MHVISCCVLLRMLWCVDACKGANNSVRSLLCSFQYMYCLQHDRLRDLPPFFSSHNATAWDARHSMCRIWRLQVSPYMYASNHYDNYYDNHCDSAIHGHPSKERAGGSKQSMHVSFAPCSGLHATRPSGVWLGPRLHDCPRPTVERQRGLSVRPALDHFLNVVPVAHAIVRSARSGDGAQHK